MIQSPTIDKMMESLVNLMAQINSVANNTDGIGRDDLGIEIFRSAEGIK